MPDSVRPLPFVTPLTRFFWSAGADGQLRLQQCDECSTFIHPPKPFCTNCGGEKLHHQVVSGQAILVGFTENHRFPLPGVPLPYVTAQVSPVEDPAVRITTRIPDAGAADLELGTLVAVEFEDAGEGFWLPLFRPVPGAEKRPLPEDAETPAQIVARVRPMPVRRKFEDDVVLSGVGASRIGRRLMVDPLALTVQACREAVADAGLEMADIDGLASYPGGALEAGFGEGGVTALESVLRLRPTWYNGGAETFGPAGSVIAAMLAVSAGLARHVLCFRTVWASTHAELAKQGEIPMGGGSRSASDMALGMPFGATSAAHVLAQNAQRHFRRYGTTRETLGWIALNQRANAARNPEAIYRTPLTMDEYLQARPITTPFGLYDCDVPCDGAVAVVVSAAESAGDLASVPVRVEAVGTQLIERVEWVQSTSAHEPQTIGPAAHLWSRTDLRPDDVDVAQLYDGFTFNCLSWIEALGFCGIGEAKDFLDGGKNIALDGQLPLNTHGGQLSHGRTHGMGLLREAIVQLRGEAGERQVKDARTAVVSSGGLTPSGVLLLRRD